MHTFLSKYRLAKLGCFFILVFLVQHIPHTAQAAIRQEEVIAKYEISSPQIFQEGKSEIREEAKVILKEAASYMKGQVTSGQLIQIKTEYYTKNAKDQALSNARINKIINFLEGEGIPRDRFSKSIVYEQNENDEVVTFIFLKEITERKELLIVWLLYVLGFILRVIG